MISEAYRAQQRELYARNPRYGTSGGNNPHLVRPVADWGRLAILDYGCGREHLKKALGPAYKVTGYDPAIDGLDSPPEPHPVVYCGDVLEHIEPEHLDDVLRDLRRCTQQRGLFVVHLGPALKTLDDGRNAHLIQRPKEWWVEKFKEHGFTIDHIGDGHGHDGDVLGMYVEVR